MQPARLSAIQGHKCRAAHAREQLCFVVASLFEPKQVSICQPTPGKCQLGRMVSALYFGAAGVPAVLKRVSARRAAPVALLADENGSQGWIRTTDLTVNNRPLYH